MYSRQHENHMTNKCRRLHSTGFYWILRQPHSHTQTLRIYYFWMGIFSLGVCFFKTTVVNVTQILLFLNEIKEPYLMLFLNIQIRGAVAIQIFFASFFVCLYMWKQQNNYYSRGSSTSKVRKQNNEVESHGMFKVFFWRFFVRF